MTNWIILLLILILVSFVLILFWKKAEAEEKTFSEKSL